MFNQGYSTSSYGSGQPPGNANEPLQFFGAQSSSAPYYPGSRSSLEGNMGSLGSGPAQGSMSGRINADGRWWEAFGTGGFDGEPSLMEGMSGTVETAVAEALRTRYQPFPHPCKVSYSSEPDLQG